MSAQNFCPWGDCSAHCGVAVASPHASVGQGAFVHSGEQMAPSMPWIWMLWPRVRKEARERQGDRAGAGGRLGVGRGDHREEMKPG